MSSSTGETLFHPEAIQGMREQDEAEREAEMEEEERRIDDEIERHVQREMAEVSLDLVESGTDDDEGEGGGGDENRRRHHHPRRPRNHEGDGRGGEEADAEDNNTPMQQQHRNRHLDYLTSTPYVPRFDIEEGLLTGDTPDGQGRLGTAHGGEDADAEGRFLHATSNAERLEILYQARGHELSRLRQEIDRLHDENGTENRRLTHEMALQKAENAQLKVRLEQAQEAYEEVAEDNRTLRGEVDMLKAAVQKHEKSREDLIARAESSDSMVHNLQNQLIDLQRKDTVLRAREHHDAIVSSLKERHESETYTLQQEVDRLSALARRYENELDLVRTKLNETKRYHESMLEEKSERIEELNRRLAESQRRLTELIVASSSGQDIMMIGDPVKEICDLKACLAAVTNQRNEQHKLVQDLSDELAEMKTQLDSSNKKNSSSRSQEELVQLRHQAAKKDKEVEEMRTNERELKRMNDKLKNDLASLQEKLNSVSKNVDESGTFKDGDAGGARQVEFLQMELRQRTEELTMQQERIKALIQEWHENAEQIKANHGKDRQEVESTKEKYRDLKRKVKGYQKHRQKEREHYRNENKELRDAFGAILLDYKTKMESSYEFREKAVEDELHSLKRQFETELERITTVRDYDEDPPTISLSSSSRPATAAATAVPATESNPSNPQAGGDNNGARKKQQPQSHQRRTGGGRSNRRRRGSSSSSSDEENNRPTSSRSAASKSEDMARIFAEVTRNVKDQLKRPTGEYQNQQYQQINQKRTPLLDRNKQK